VKIRRARLDDIEVIHALLDQLLPAALDRQKPMWRKLLRMEGYLAWVAEVDSVSAGFLDLFTFPDMAHGGTMGLIDNLVVDGRFRGQGVGQALLRKAIAECRRRRLMELHLWTDFGNEAAIGLYKKLGFRGCSLLMELQLRD